MVTTGAITGISLVVLFELALPVAAYFLLRRRTGLAARNLWVGAAVFLVMVVLLEGPLNNFLLRVHAPTADWFKSHPLAMGLYGALAAALFEETGRLLGLRFLVRRGPGVATPLAYGLGHGGVECILVGAVNTAAVLVIGLVIQSGHAASLKLPPEALTVIQAQLASAHFFSSLLGGLERASALVLQIFLSFLVWRAVTGRKVLLWLAAVGLHFAMDLPAGLMQARVISTPVLWLEAGYAAAAIVMAWTLIRARPVPLTTPPSVLLE